MFYSPLIARSARIGFAFFSTYRTPVRCICLMLSWPAVATVRWPERPCNN